VQFSHRLIVSWLQGYELYTWRAYDEIDYQYVNVADIDLFCKMTKAHYCAHSLLPPVKSCTHNLRPEGHTYELPRCDTEMYKNSFVPRCLYRYCNFSHCICVFIFYFISIVYYVIYQLSACTSDTCILKDQSINQSNWAVSRALTCCRNGFSCLHMAFCARTITLNW